MSSSTPALGLAVVMASHQNAGKPSLTRKALMKKISAYLVLTAALILTGCATSSPATPPTTTNEQPSPESTEAQQPKDTFGFGEEAVYPDDVSITVSAPEEFVPGQFAAGTDQASNIVFTFTITNGGDKKLEPVVYTSVSSGGVEATPIYDMDQDVSSDPQTVILPGQSVTWKRAWSVADPNSLVLQTTPAMFVYDDTIFTNTK